MKQKREYVDEIKKELFSLYKKYQEIKSLVKSIEKGDLSNGIRFHYIPKQDKPIEPNNEYFKYMMSVIYQTKKKMNNVKEKYFKPKATKAS